MRDPAAPDTLKAYLIGFYCHYFLDSTLHPYVYFLTGRICERAPDHPSAVHAKIEAELDSVFCAHFLHIPVSQFPVTRYFRIPEEDKNAISLWYQTLLKEVFRLPAGLKNIRHCFGDFSQLGAAFYAHPYILSGLGAFLSKLYQPAQIIAAHIKSPQAVSYTHLDVYKRQRKAITTLPFSYKVITTSFIPLSAVTVCPNAFACHG